MSSFQCKCNLIVIIFVFVIVCKISKVSLKGVVYHFNLCSSSCGEILGEALHMIGLGESCYERQFGKPGGQKENLVTNCQTNSNRLSFLDAGTKW